MVTRMDRETLRGLLLASGVALLTTESTREEAVRAVVRIAHLSRGLIMWGDRARVYAATIDQLEDVGLTLGWIVEEVFDDPITREVAHGWEEEQGQGESLHAEDRSVVERDATIGRLLEERRRDAAGKQQRPEGPVIQPLPPRDRVQASGESESMGGAEAG